MVKVLFVHGYQPAQIASFVRQDLAILRQLYHVEELSLFTFTSKFRGPLSTPAIWNAVYRNDLVFGWFTECAPVILIARLLRKPALLVGGGADVVSIPEISYGLTISGLKYWLATLGLKLATQVLLFSDSSRKSLLNIPGIRPTKLQTLYLGVDCDHFTPLGAKKAQALTVGYITRSNLRRKGLQTFVEAARHTPEISYRVVGNPTDQDALNQLKAVMGVNVAYLGYLDEIQLLNEYRNSRVYAQLSMHEGFGMALAEAMACECIPVITNRGAIPEVVGDTGIYVPLETPLMAGEAIRQIILDPANEKMGQQARQRVMELFPISKRKEGIQDAVETAMR